MLAIGVQGIGGMNSFNAGVLQKFREYDVYPDLLSVTSGAILSAYYYLDENPYALDEFYKKYFQKTNGETINKTKFIEYALTGMPDVFRLINPWERYIKYFPFLTLDDWLKFCFPAQTYESVRPHCFFEDIAHRFYKSDIGIICNAYHYQKDKAILYVNPAACEKAELRVGEHNDYIVKEVCADGIKSCLQLLQYGDNNGEYDGAYQYNPPLLPLIVADQIILITVEQLETSSKDIETYFDIEDFKLKMLFKNAIHAQLNQIKLINKYIHEGKIRGEKATPVHVSIIQPNEHRGYFDYFIETPHFFKSGKEQASLFLDDSVGIKRYAPLTVP